MKKLIKLAFCFLGVVALISCDQDAKYDTIDSSLIKIVGFPQNTVSYTVDPSSATATFEVLASRADVSKSETYKLSYEISNANMAVLNLQIPESVTFATGEATAKVPVTVATTSLQPNVYYPFTLTMPDVYTPDVVKISEENEVDRNAWLDQVSVNVRVTMMLDWVTIGTGTYTYNPLYGSGSSKQEIQQVEGTIYYRFPNLYVTGTHIEFTMNEDGTINVPAQITGDEFTGYGPIWVRTHPEANGPSVRIGNTFTFYNYYYMPEGGAGFNYNVPETFVLD